METLPLLQDYQDFPVEYHDRLKQDIYQDQIMADELDHETSATQNYLYQSRKAMLAKILFAVASYALFTIQYMLINNTDRGGTRNGFPIMIYSIFYCWAIYLFGSLVSCCESNWFPHVSTYKFSGVDKWGYSLV